MNFQQMTLEQLELERLRLLGEIDRLDGILQARGEHFARTDNDPRALSREIQDIIERLVKTLLPNLFLPTLNSLKNTFPNEPQLTDVEPETLSPKDTSLWGSIKRFFGVSKLLPNPNLERQRVLLRNVLWNLTVLPANNGNYQYLFLLLLQKKQELAAAEKIAENIELNSDETLLQRQNLLAQLKECEREIARRKSKGSDNYHRRRTQPIQDDERDVTPIYYPSSRDSDDNYSSGSSSSYQDSSTGYDSNTSVNSSDSGAQASSGADFSFGGGGDFAGGGAGGSWDNYS